MRGRDKRALAGALAGLAAVAGLALAGCGRLLPVPTQTAASIVEITALATETPRPTATRRATVTPAPATPSNTPTPTATATPVYYSIKKGDTLQDIAAKFGVNVRDIQQVNGISDPRRLRVGQEIIIPARQGNAGPTTMPSPTPVALAIEGLAFYQTPVGSMWCLGEVVNRTTEPAEEVQVQVSLHDDKGQLLALGAAFTQLDVIAGEGRSPFAVLFTAPPTSFAQYQTLVLSGVRSTHLGPRYPYLKVVEQQGAWASEGNYQVKGQVQNAGQADADHVAVIITLYDEQDHVVAARSVGIAADIFLAGASAPFDVTLTPLGPVDRVSVAVQGWRVEYVMPAADSPTPAMTGTPEP